MSIKSYLEIDTLPGFLGGGTISVDAVELFYPATKTKVQGLRIEVRKNEDITGVSFVDIDEINGLLKGIDYIAKELGEGCKFKMFEANYRTKSGFEITVFNESDSTISCTITSGIASIHGDVSAIQRLRSLINKGNAALIAK